MLDASSLDRSLRQGDLRESIHGSVNGLAADARHLVQCSREVQRPPLQGLKDLRGLLLEELVGWLARHGRFHHEPHEDLPESVRGQGGCRHLRELRQHRVREAYVFHVAATLATLTNDALGSGMETDQLRLGVALFILCLKLPQHFLEGVELLPLSIDVGLVDLVCQDHELLLGGEVDDHDDVLAIQNGSHGISRVDHGDCTELGAISECICCCLLELLLSGAPPFLFVHVVVDDSATGHCQCSAVQRILRPRDEHPAPLVLEES
mmetsp:Transcript_110993/g.264826  ORF Transcript_110993/g.264826 Transcript_110993/m.264826 type:complete len:265 (+) Transcript_110993:271-1065(+)